eukprot:TRINITY_DN2351_c0_g1_i1.p1 TRINITY_DN2351_c0_g1~~TRINITY_DN2351_c0_g1_i1.p1  ORF type:complete len:977 (+),score=215.34 TRINITY_DN2351_c0_g1_i1:44-2974(+)
MKRKREDSTDDDLHQVTKKQKLLDNDLLESKIKDSGVTLTNGKEGSDGILSEVVSVVSEEMIVISDVEKVSDDNDGDEDSVDENNSIVVIDMMESEMEVDGKVEGEVMCVDEDDRGKAGDDDSDSDSLGTDFNMMYIPYEIMLDIFFFLSTEDLKSCRYVCMYWQEITEDDCLAWTEFCHVTKAPTNVPFYDLSTEDGKLPEKFKYHINFDVNRSTYQPPKDIEESVFQGIQSQTEFWKVEPSDFVLKKYENSSFTESFNIFLNLRRLESFLRNEYQEGAKIEGESLIFQKVVSVNENWLVSNSPEFDQDIPYIPVTDYELLPQPTELNITLKHYQQKAMSWMVYVENSLEEVSFIKNNPWFDVNCGVVFDLIKKRFVLKQDSERERYSINGGILADEMGMGKTIEVLSLILKNPSPQVNREDIDFSEFLFPCKATLIVCPSQICAQWEDEVKSHVNVDLNVHVIASVRDHKNLTIDQVIDADIIIITVQYLKNQNYFRLGGYGKGVSKHREIQVRFNVWLSEIREILRETPDNGLSQSRPPFEFFKWNRIVFDEGHEYMYEKYYNDMFKHYVSNHRWLVTGTPKFEFRKFESKGSFDTVCSAINFLADTPEVTEELNEEQEDIISGLSHSPNYYMKRRNELRTVEKYRNHLKYSYVLKNLFWRNLKSNVGEEYQLADYVDCPIYIDFHPIEKGIYDCSEINSGFKLRGFTHVFYTRNAKSLYILLEEKLLSVKDQKSQFTHSQKHFRENRYKEFQEKIDKCKEFIRDLKALQERFKDMTQKKNIYQLDLGAKGGTIDPNFRLEKDQFNLEDAIDTYGSKVAHMLDYMLKLDDESRVLIFSQDTVVLQNIESVLHTHNVETCTLYGNIYVRNKAIRDFKEGSKRVMLLNLKGSESGTNLYDATHVLLIDPATKYNLANQKQAIGRAHRLGRTGDPVKVVRFIIRDTFEEEKNKKYLLERDNKAPVRTSSLSGLNVN